MQPISILSLSLCFVLICIPLLYLTPSPQCWCPALSLPSTTQTFSTPAPSLLSLTSCFSLYPSALSPFPFSLPLFFSPSVRLYCSFAPGFLCQSVCPSSHVSLSISILLPMSPFTLSAPHCLVSCSSHFLSVQLPICVFSYSKALLSVPVSPSIPALHPMIFYSPRHAPCPSFCFLLSLSPFLTPVLSPMTDRWLTLSVPQCLLSLFAVSHSQSCPSLCLLSALCPPFLSLCYSVILLLCPGPLSTFCFSIPQFCCLSLISFPSFLPPIPLILFLAFFPTSSPSAFPYSCIPRRYSLHCVFLLFTFPCSPSVVFTAP